MHLAFAQSQSSCDRCEDPFGKPDNPRLRPDMSSKRGNKWAYITKGATEMGSDDAIGKTRDGVLAVVRWVKSRSPREKTYLMGFAGLLTLLMLWRTIEDHDTLFVLAEAIHFVGIGVLAYKLQRKKSAAGISLETQILTAIFLTFRLFCSFMMEYDIHTVLDLLTLVATAVVIVCMVSAKDIRLTYQKDQDTLKWWMVAVPCLILGLIAHPKTSHKYYLRILWGYCVYQEAVSVLPQLRMMQKAKVVERFTAHYVFALGLSRFFSCAHWILQLLEGNKYLLHALGSGLWPVMVLLSEVVQTFILADFCYHYIKSYAEGTGIVRLPAGIV